jgi:hypothetical protein
MNQNNADFKVFLIDCSIHGGAKINLALGMILCAAMQTGQRFAVY